MLEGDRRIEIQRPSVTRSAKGENETTWGPLPATDPEPTKAWARVAQRSAREFFTADQTVAERRLGFTLRFRSDIEVTDRLLYGGQIYDIQAIREVGRRQWLELHAVARD